MLRVRASGSNLGPLAIAWPAMPTTGAFGLVHAQEQAAFGAEPLPLLVANEVSDAELLDHREILDHAHPVSDSIPLVELLQPPAREGLALAGTAGGFGLRGLLTVADCARQPT